MKITPKIPPRTFEVAPGLVHKDCAHVALEAGEQVTFTTPGGAEYDVARMKWGFYATPSINGRLKRFNLRTALVRNEKQQCFILLVEKGSEDDFQNYLLDEKHEVVCWLDENIDLRGNAQEAEKKASVRGPSHTCLCGGNRFTTIFTYDGPVQGEIRFAYSLKEGYWREVRRCVSCGHFLEFHDLNDADLYAEDYVTTTYGDDAGLKRAFDKINALDPAKSDNVGRVDRILKITEQRNQRNQPTVLDVGSGLCVFLHRMKQKGWVCTAVDMDPRQIRHATEVVGVRAVCGDLLKLHDLGKFDLITFNKVLEHVKDPVSLLRGARTHLNSGGWIYVEVPDGETAVVGGREREEFLLGHLHVFSASSLAILASRAGFWIQRLERLREPSGKYTLWAMLTC